MVEYKTKYFGSFFMSNDVEKYLVGKIKLNETFQFVNIKLVDCYQYYDKIDKCVKIVDEYYKINQIGKKAIIKNHKDNGIIKDYLNNNFIISDDFIFVKDLWEDDYKESKKYTINELLEEICPAGDIDIFYENNQFFIVIAYSLIIESDETIMVEMDKNLKIKGIEII